MTKVALLERTPDFGVLNCAEDPVLSLVLQATPSLGARKTSTTSHQFHPDAYLEVVEILESIGYISVSKNFTLPLPGKLSMTWCDLLFEELGQDSAIRATTALVAFFESDGFVERYSTAVRGSLSKLFH